MVQVVFCSPSAARGPNTMWLLVVSSLLCCLCFFGSTWSQRMTNPVSNFQASAMQALAQGFPLDRVMAGRIPTCDDGRTNLTVDWDGSSKEYTCLEFPWKTSEQMVSEASCGPTPPQALHFCMTDQIHYTDVPPTSGNHRPTWPTYGEYRYLPPQRWLHSLEHGAVVMLYHPCADAAEVKKLRAVVTGCLRRYIITPYDKLPKEAPFALLTWGCKLMLSRADEKSAQDFIQARGINFGAEQVEQDGDFTEQLIKQSEVVPGSDLKDSHLCPKASGSKLAM